MIYSNACEYAIRAMSQLAMLKPGGGYVLMSDICEDSDLPRHFVAKIFQDLVRDGLLRSAKGRGGGFALARPAGKITLMEIVEAIDGTERFDQCIVGMSRCDDQQPCPQHDQFKSIRVKIKVFLRSTTLEKMATALQRKLELIRQRPQHVQTTSST